MLACAIVLCSTAAFAQSAPPPPVADKPLVQSKPKESPKEKPKAGKPQSIAVRLQACQDLDDGTKERLNCYDAVLVPAPRPKPAAAKTVMECKFVKEEDARLGCYNGFVDSMPRLPRS
jgi:hypothetical protein